MRDSDDSLYPSADMGDSLTKVWYLSRSGSSDAQHCWREGKRRVCIAGYWFTFPWLPATLDTSQAELVGSERRDLRQSSGDQHTSTQPTPTAHLTVRVFLASPGDVSDERALALRVLERLPYDPFLRGRIVVETVAWDKPGADTPMLATLTPQEAISQQRPKPSECDIVIVIFWSRMGTPLPPEYVKDDGSAYLSGTEWEYLDALQASLQTGRPKVLVYRRTEVPSIALDDPKFQEKQDQWHLVKEFFASFRTSGGAIRRAVNSYDTPDAFEKKLTEHLREIVKALLVEHEATPQPPATETPPDAADEPEGAQEPPLWEGSPFPGLRAFGEDDAPIYFGRGRETDGLVRRLAEGARFIAVVGASGSGKSSLVAAGLLPRLKDNAIPGSRDWVPVRLTPGELGENPFIALASRFRPELAKQNRQVRDAAVRLETDPDTLGELVALLLEGRPEWSELLLFVDQFEELFTVVGERYREPFIALLARPAALPRLRIVATLRADFYHRCLEQPALEEPLRAGSYPLAAPGVGALHEMIHPARGASGPYLRGRAARAHPGRHRRRARRPAADGLRPGTALRRARPRRAAHAHRLRRVRRGQGRHQPTRRGHLQSAGPSRSGDSPPCSGSWSRWT